MDTGRGERHHTVAPPSHPLCDLCSKKTYVPYVVKKQTS